MIWIGEQAIERICAYARPEDLCYAWSGGKDSLVIEWLCRAAGVSGGILYVPNLDVEWTFMQSWWEQELPIDCSIYRDAGLNLGFYQRHPHLLTAYNAGANQHYNMPKWTAQFAYAEGRKAQAIIMGRRTIDGNPCGPHGVSGGRNGVQVLNPIYDWSHEDVLAFIRYKKLVLPPTYFMPNGFHLNNQRWIASKPTQRGLWELLREYDMDSLQEAARYFPNAAVVLG